MAKTIFNGVHLKVIKAKKTELKEAGLKPGAIQKIDATGLFVVCGDRCLLQIITIQLPNKKPTNISAMIHGAHMFAVHETFSNYEF